ncbi:MAG: DinB family protein [Vicinamibacterales bacterium]
MTAFDVLAATLDDLARAVRPLTRTEYTHRDRATSGTIGAHVRHCLDHVEALERALVRGVCCYDDRVRGTATEDDPAVACARLAACRMRLSGLDAELLQTPLTLSAVIDDRGTTVRALTTVGRELAFVISHTIHHAALIAVLLEDFGRERPERFGLAPTTPALEPVCAR